MTLEKIHFPYSPEIWKSAQKVKVFTRKRKKKQQNLQNNCWMFCCLIYLIDSIWFGWSEKHYSTLAEKKVVFEHVILVSSILSAENIFLIFFISSLIQLSDLFKAWAISIFLAPSTENNVWAARNVRNSASAFCCLWSLQKSSLYTFWKSRSFL